MGNVVTEQLAGAAAGSCTWCVGRTGRRLPDGPLMTAPLAADGRKAGIPQETSGRQPMYKKEAVLATTMRRTPSGKDITGAVQGLRRRRSSVISPIVAAANKNDQTSESSQTSAAGSPQLNYEEAKKKRFDGLAKLLLREAQVGQTKCNLCLSEDRERIQWLSSKKKQIGSLKLATVAKIETVPTNERALKILCTNSAGSQLTNVFTFETQKNRQEWEESFQQLLDARKNLNE